jgi:hypothetical protein
MIDNAMMLQIKKPATCNSPTQNSPSRSPRTGDSGCRVATSAGAISARLPASRGSTKRNEGTWPSASFINGQLAAQVSTIAARRA